MATRRSTQPLDHLEALKDYICAEPRLDQYTRGDGGKSRESGRRGRNDCVLSASRGRGGGVGGDGLGVLCAWANTPRCLLLPSHFSPKGKQSSGSCICLSMCARVGEVDIRGLDTSRRESPPTNRPPGALGHWPPIITPSRSPGRAAAPCHQPHISRNEDIAARREEPRKATLAGF